MYVWICTYAYMYGFRWPFGSLVLAEAASNDTSRLAFFSALSCYMSCFVCSFLVFVLSHVIFCIFIWVGVGGAKNILSPLLLAGALNFVKLLRHRLWKQRLGSRKKSESQRGHCGRRDLVLRYLVLGLFPNQNWFIFLHVMKDCTTQDHEPQDGFWWLLMASWRPCFGIPCSGFGELQLSLCTQGLGRYREFQLSLSTCGPEPYRKLQISLPKPRGDLQITLHKHRRRQHIRTPATHARKNVRVYAR